MVPRDNTKICYGRNSLMPSSLKTPQVIFFFFLNIFTKLTVVVHIGRITLDMILSALGQRYVTVTWQLLSRLTLSRKFPTTFYSRTRISSMQRTGVTN
jgi:hypothetical protein